MADIERKYRVRYYKTKGKGTKVVRVKMEEEDLLNCNGVLKEETQLIIPLVKAQYPDLFKGCEIYNIGWMQ